MAAGFPLVSFIRLDAAVGEPKLAAFDAQLAEEAQVGDVHARCAILECDQQGLVSMRRTNRCARLTDDPNLYTRGWCGR
eukprot:3474204-Prymnesium_polylepis.1